MISDRKKEDVPASFRDPSGFIFCRDNALYRQINQIYREDYKQLIDSGLYKHLVEEGFLVAHEEVSILGPRPEVAYKVIRPDPVPFISYPYEWCFSQLKDAALATLSVQKIALSSGMSLKDCSAYNIQFSCGRPILIDTLSFERYKEGMPWVAYRQFCQHFLAPLALMSMKDVRLNQLSRIYIDGIPLDLASSLLPFGSRLRFSLFTHIHLHARSQKRYADRVVEKSNRNFGSLAFRGIIDSLETSIRRLTWQPEKTEWGSYYSETNYTSSSFMHKRELLGHFLTHTNPTTVWDLGANTGFFSRVASDRSIPTVSFDIDPAAVEKNYLQCVKNGEKHLLPLCLDLTNPSPGIGWENEERPPFLYRGPADTVLALALVHHLAISNNVPLDRLAAFFGKVCSRALIIEFVPKKDSQVQRLLTTRDDIFTDYTETAFEKEFNTHFIIEKVSRIKDSERTLYLMRSRKTN